MLHRRKSCSNTNNSISPLIYYIYEHQNIYLDNQKFKIIYKILFYIPLIIALWNLLSENEKQSLIFNNNNDQKIINLNDN